MLPRGKEKEKKSKIKNKYVNNVCKILVFCSVTFFLKNKYLIVEEFLNKNAEIF